MAALKGKGGGGSKSGGKFKGGSKAGGLGGGGKKGNKRRKVCLLFSSCHDD